MTKLKKMTAIISCLIASVSTSAIVFASGGTNPQIDFSEVTQAITGAGFTVGTVMSIIGSVLSAGLSLVLAWWGARKLINAIMNAFKNGRVKV